MSNLNFGVNILPTTSGLSLGADGYEWDIFGDVTGDLDGIAAKATKANIITSTNSVASYSDAQGTFDYISSSKGALYSTGSAAKPTFGTLPIEEGGTGATTFVNNSVIIFGTSGSTALSSRSLAEAIASPNPVAALSADSTDIPTVGRIR